MPFTLIRNENISVLCLNLIESYIQVKTSEAAKNDYDEAVSEGRTAFLMESTRPDILQISVGHLAPGSTCSVSITYISEVPLEIGRARLTIPTTISPKYIPFTDGSEEAKRIASIQYDFKSPAKLSFKLNTTMKSRIEKVTSPSHDINTTGGKEVVEEGFYTAETTLESTTVDLDRDIIILVECEDSNKSIIFVEETDESKVMMVSLVPKLEVNTQPDLDIVFLIDCSGSMMGSSIQLAKEAINILLHSLPASVHFNIIRFGSSYKMLFPESRKYSDQTLREAKSAMSKLEADLGGTEILSPLCVLLEEKTKVPRRIFILTDGSVSNSFECIKVTRKNNKKNRVFTLGIGSGADRHLVKGLARSGLGTSVFTVEGEIMAPKIIKQLKNCLQPSFENAEINWGNEVGPGNSCQAPSTIPPIYDGSRIQVFRLFEKNISVPDLVKVSAEILASRSKDASFSEEIKVETTLMKDSLLHKMFGRKMIQELEENYEEKEEGEIKNLVTDLSLKYQIMSKFTSFIAVDTKENKGEKKIVKRHVANQVPQGFGIMMMCSAPAPMMRCASSRMPTSSNQSRSIRSFLPNMKQKKKSKKIESYSSEMDYCDAKMDTAECMNMEVLADEESEESIVGGEVLEVDPEKLKMQNLLCLIALQTAEGSFSKDKHIFSVCELDEEKVEMVRGSLDEKVFYTSLVLLLLELRFLELKDCWEMVAEKGKLWRQNKSVPDTLNQDLLQILKN